MVCRKTTGVAVSGLETIMQRISSALKMGSSSRDFPSTLGRTRKKRAGKTRLAHLEVLEIRALLSAATVNWSTTYQTIDGFGASSAWASGTWNATTMNLLFSPTTG